MELQPCAHPAAPHHGCHRHVAGRLQGPLHKGYVNGISFATVHQDEIHLQTTHATHYDGGTDHDGRHCRCGVSHRYIDELKTTTAQKSAIESELSVARRIQMSMLTTDMPERTGIFGEVAEELVAIGRVGRLIGNAPDDDVGAVVVAGNHVTQLVLGVLIGFGILPCDSRNSLLPARRRCSSTRH